MRPTLTLIAVIVFATVAACGGGEPGGGGGTGNASSSSSSGSSSSGLSGYAKSVCDKASDSACVEQDLPSSAIAAEDQACTDQGGTTPDACPSDGLLGCCTYSNAVNTVTCFYSGGSIDAAAAEAGCSQGMGAWSTSH